MVRVWPFSPKVIVAAGVAGAGAEEVPGLIGGAEFGMGAGEVLGGEPAGDGVGDGAAGSFLGAVMFGDGLAEALLDVVGGGGDGWDGRDGWDGWRGGVGWVHSFLSEYSKVHGGGVS